MSAPAGQSVGQPASQSGGLFPQPATLALELWPAESTFQLDSLGSARLVSLSAALLCSSLWRAVRRRDVAATGKAALVTLFSRKLDHFFHSSQFGGQLEAAATSSAARKPQQSEPEMRTLIETSSITINARHLHPPEPRVDSERAPRTFPLPPPGLRGSLIGPLVSVGGRLGRLLLRSQHFALADFWPQHPWRASFLNQAPAN